MSLCLSASPAFEANAVPPREGILSRVRRLLSFDTVEDEGELMPAPTGAEVTRAFERRRTPPAGDVNALLL